jgi:hypothetical protein
MGEIDKRGKWVVNHDNYLISKLFLYKENK